MKNNQNNIKNFIKKYFIGGDSDIQNISEVNQQTPLYVKQEPIKYKKLDISKNIENKGLARAMQALQISNPFKGV